MKPSKPLSSDILMQNGQCCGNGCKNCPYFPRHIKGNCNFKRLKCLKCSLNNYVDLSGEGFVCFNCGEMHEYLENGHSRTDNIVLIFEDGRD